MTCSQLPELAGQRLDHTSDQQQVCGSCGAVADGRCDPTHVFAHIAVQNGDGDACTDGPTHFIVLSNAGQQIQDVAAELRDLHPGTQLSGGGAHAVFLDAGSGSGPKMGRDATVAIGFQCVNNADHTLQHPHSGQRPSFRALCGTSARGGTW